MMRKLDIISILDKKIAENVLKMKGLDPVPFENIMEIKYKSRYFGNMPAQAFSYMTYKIPRLNQIAQITPSLVETNASRFENHKSYITNVEYREKQYKEMLISREVITEKFAEKLSSYMNICLSYSDSFYFNENSEIYILYYSLEEIINSLENEFIELNNGKQFNKLYLTPNDRFFTPSPLDCFYSDLVENVKFTTFETVKFKTVKDEDNGKVNGVIDLSNILGKNINLNYCSESVLL